MTRPGDLYIYDRAHPEEGLYLHAWKDISMHEIYRQLVSLPSWYVQRARLAQSTGDDSLGPVALLRAMQQDGKTWDQIGHKASVNKYAVAAMLCSRVHDLWTPLNPDHVHWSAKVSSMEIECYEVGYTVYPNKLRALDEEAPVEVRERFDVEFQSYVGKLFAVAAAEPAPGMLEPGLYSVIVLRDDETWTQPVYRITEPCSEQELRSCAELQHGGFISYGVHADDDADHAVICTFRRPDLIITEA